MTALNWVEISECPGFAFGFPVRHEKKRAFSPPKGRHKTERRKAGPFSPQEGGERLRAQTQIHLLEKVWEERLRFRRNGYKEGHAHAGFAR